MMMRLSFISLVAIFVGGVGGNRSKKKKKKGIVFRSIDFY